LTSLHIRLTEDPQDLNYRQLLGVEVDPCLAGCRRKRRSENANLFSQIVDPTGHPLVDCVRNHRDEKPEGRRQHRGERRLPVPTGRFKPVLAAESCELARDGFLDTAAVNLLRRRLKGLHRPTLGTFHSYRIVQTRRVPRPHRMGH
jgi:hypothetical protein